MVGGYFEFKEWVAAIFLLDPSVFVVDSGRPLSFSMEVALVSWLAVILVGRLYRYHVASTFCLAEWR